MARRDTASASAVLTPLAPRPGVGRTSTGWYAAHACGWIETGFSTSQGAARMLERHVAYVCSAPSCHHP